MPVALPKFLRGDAFIGALLALVSFAVYASTMSPTMGWEDDGEIAASLGTLGIVHPTGYPLFTMVGWAFSHLPIGGRVIWRLNLMVALLCAVSVYFFYRIFLFLLSEDGRTLFRGQAPTASSREKFPAPPPEVFSNRLVAAVAALTLAFSRTFWSQAVTLEVYALHLFFLALVTFLFLRALAEHLRHPGAAANRWWAGFAFALGLSFTNHMMTVLLAPAFLYLFFAVEGFGRVAGIRLARAVFPFLAGLLPYLYLPWRASQKPFLNWGDPSTAANLWRHVSAHEYRGAMFSSLEVAEKKLGHFLIAFPAEFGYFPLLLGLAGLWALFHRSRRLLVFSLLLFAASVIYAINYDFDDPNFYLNAYFATALWILAGLSALRARAGMGRRPFWAIAAAVALCPLGFNHAANDRRGDYAVEDYARNMLASLDSGAVLLTYQWDNFVAASWYLQRVEGARPDVTVLDRELLKSSWYLDQWERAHPLLAEGVRPEMDALRQEIVAFESGGAYSAAVLKARLGDLIRAVLRESAQAGPVYAAPEIEDEYVREFRKVPSGLVFRLFRDSMTYVPGRDFSMRPLLHQTPGVEDLKQRYAAAYANQGAYQAMNGNYLAARRFLEMSLSLRPDFQQARNWLRQLDAVVGK